LTKGADAFHQKTLRERLLDVVVGAHAQAEHLVDLVVLGGQEDHRHLGLLAHALQQVHSVHAGHLDVKDRHVGHLLVEGVQRGLAVIVGFDLESLGLKCHRNRCQDVPVIVHEGNFRHGIVSLYCSDCLFFCHYAGLCTLQQSQTANQAQPLPYFERISIRNG